MGPAPHGGLAPDPPASSPPPAAHRFAALRPWLGAAVALVVWGTALTLMASTRWQGDLAGFARFSTDWPWAGEIAGVDPALRTRSGYDGQFYAALAADPLLLEDWTAGALDNPPYRAGRILVPLAAWLASFGRGEVAVRLYVVLCWAMALVLIRALYRWQRAEGGSPEWLLALAFCGGVVASTARALPDAAAAGLIVLALGAHERGRNGGALALNVAAVLCRETSLLASLALALVDLRARRWRAGLAQLGLPVVVLGAWKLWLAARIGASDVAAAKKLLGMPLGWLTDKAAAFPGQTPIAQLADLLAVTTVLLAVAAAVPMLLRWRRWQALEAAYVGFAALALVMTYPVYAEPFAYSRALILLPILGLPLAARRPASGEAWMVRGSAILAAFAGVVLLWIDLVPALKRLLA